MAANPTEKETETRNPFLPLPEIERNLRSFWDQQVEVEAKLNLDGDRASFEPHLDSLVAVQVFLILKPLVPFELRAYLIRPGGYENADDFVNDLLTKLKKQWEKKAQGGKKQ